MTCHICSTTLDGHCVHSLAERVAKLEALVARKLVPTVPELPRCDAYDNMPQQCDAFDVNHANGPCDGTGDEGLASGQLESAGEAKHVCKCKNDPCPACGGDGPDGEWFEGGEVRCNSCGVMLVVATIETCDGSSTFELLDEPPAPSAGTWSASDHAKAREVADSFRDILPDAPAAGTLSGFDWRRLGCGETSRSSRLACAGNDGGPHDDVCDLVTEALEDGHHRLGAQVAALTARLAQAERDKASVTQSLVDEYDKRKQAERERDDWRARYDAAVADGRTLREAWERAEKERDEAYRLLERFAEALGYLYYEPSSENRPGWMARLFELLDIRSGKPAPGTDNGVAENCASAAAAFAENNRDRPRHG
jgi:hypothetical protein